jgi:hypothetical protein
LSCLVLSCLDLSNPLLSLLTVLPILQVEGDEGGYDEEFPLEGLELNTSDFMAKVAVGDFRRSWEEVHAF